MRRTILTSLLFFTFIVLFSFSASAFELQLYTYNSTFQAHNATNVTVSCAFGGCTGFQDRGPWSGLSNASGWVNFTVNVNEQMSQFVDFVVTAKAYGPDGNLSLIGPAFPPLQKNDLENKLGNKTIYMGDGATIRLYAVNATYDSQGVGYMVMDTNLGFPIAENFQNPSLASDIHVLADRNYSVLAIPMVIGGNGNPSSPPVGFTTTNYTAYQTSSGTIVAPITINTSFGFTSVWGWALNHEGQVSGYGNFTNVNYFLQSGFKSSTDFVLPDLAAFFGDTGHVAANATSGRFNVSLVSVLDPHIGENTTDGPRLQGDGFSSVLGLYAYNGSDGADGAWLAYQNITTVFGETQIQMNVTLQNASGEFTASPVGNDTGYMGTGLNYTSLQVVFQEVNTSGFVRNLTDLHAEYSIDYNFGNTPFTINWQGGVISGSQYRLFMTYNSTATVKVFSKQFAPQKVVVNASLSTPQYVNLTRFAPQRFTPKNEGGGNEGNFTDFADSGITMLLLKNQASCNVQEPDLADCRIGDQGFDGGFDPLSLPIGGKVNIYTRTNTGTTTYFIGVDLLASGPPDVAMSDTPTEDSTAGENFDEFYKFGSVAPDIYDKVYVGVPYNKSALNDNETVNVTISTLYDEGNNVVWNGTVFANGTNTPSEWADYNQTWFNASVNGMQCSNDTSSPCFINSTNSTMWFDWPHFSNNGASIVGAKAPSVAATTPAASSSSSSSSSSSGGGGGGGGGAISTTPKTISIRAKVTKVYGKVEAGKEVSTKVSHANVAVSKVVFTPTIEGKVVNVIVASLKEKPTDIEKPSTMVYEYLNLEVTNVDAFDSAVVEFEVPSTWLAQENIKEEDVRLMRWDGSRWNALDTEKTGERGGVVVFTSKTPGFSIFAIGGTPVMEEIVDVAETQEEVNKESEPTREISADPVVNQEKSSKGWIWFVLVVMVIVGLWWILSKGKPAKKEGKPDFRPKSSR